MDIQNTSWWSHCHTCIRSAAHDGPKVNIKIRQLISVVKKPLWTHGSLNSFHLAHQHWRHYYRRCIKLNKMQVSIVHCDVMTGHRSLGVTKTVARLFGSFKALKWQQCILTKRYYSGTKTYGVTTQKTICILTAVKTWLQRFCYVDLMLACKEILTQQGAFNPTVKCFKNDFALFQQHFQVVVETDLLPCSGIQASFCYATLHYHKL